MYGGFGYAVQLTNRAKGFTFVESVQYVASHRACLAAGTSREVDLKCVLLAERRSREREQISVDVSRDACAARLVLPREDLHGSQHFDLEGRDGGQ